MSRIDDVRHAALQMFKADPSEFDLVFVANATAGIKLIIDALGAAEQGFHYYYHFDSHTSLVGAREAARSHHCFESDEAVERWLAGNIRKRRLISETTQRPFEHRDSAQTDYDSSSSSSSAPISELSMEERPQYANSTSSVSEDPPQPDPVAQASNVSHLFAFPAQSNMDGRRLPLPWIQHMRSMRNGSDEKHYTFLDAAALVSTSPLDMSDLSACPDFTVLSFYKMFGFPDLGALIIRKDAGHIFSQRRYFGGGTVDMVSSFREQWHVPKTSTLHDSLEDGTLPIHSIIALGVAMDVHKELYGSFGNISAHTLALTQELYQQLRDLRHWNGLFACNIFRQEQDVYGRRSEYGPVLAFNLQDSLGNWISNTEVEKLATIHNIHLRSGGLCNPGGTAQALNLAPWELKQNFSAGARCGSENDVINGKPTGILRISLGAMTTRKDIDKFVSFIQDFFVDQIQPIEVREGQEPRALGTNGEELHVEKLTIYPIKSCAGWDVPVGTDWPIKSQGLAWDREWVLVHPGTGAVLSQKKQPKMALIQPQLVFGAGRLRIRFKEKQHMCLEPPREIEVPLSEDPAFFSPDSTSIESRDQNAVVCGDSVAMRVYTTPEISEFFSSVLGVPCRLARLQASFASGLNTSRRVKPHLQPTGSVSRGNVGSESLEAGQGAFQPLLSSNESPILIITRPSLDRLNEDLLLRYEPSSEETEDTRTLNKSSSLSKSRQSSKDHFEIPPSVFRANIILSPTKPSNANDSNTPYVEDNWSSISVLSAKPTTTPLPTSSRQINILGPCRRCQMITIDPSTGQHLNSPGRGEPFVTLAKTRRWKGMVWFGVHAALATEENGEKSDSKKKGVASPTIRVGQAVRARMGER